MSDEAPAIERARREAADWFAQLNRRTVTTQELLDFRTWRRADKVNDDAYVELERLWLRANHLLHDADLLRATDEAGARPKPKGLPGHLFGPGRKIITGLIITGLAIAGAAAFQYSRGKTYETATGEQRLLSLEDGSRVRLDTQTKIRVRFGAKDRRIELAKGQAFFEVAHDAARPFWVEADHTRVRAIGTRFDVRRAAGDVQVTLVEGQVRVTGDADPQAFILAPGQQIVLGDKVSRPAPRGVETATATSWTTGRLVFRALPLGAAVAEVNRYSRAKVSLQAGALAATPVTGAFDSGDTEAFVAAVCDLYGLKADRRSDGSILLRATGAAS